MKFESERAIFRPVEEEAADAMVRLGRVDVQDMAYVYDDAPIMYDVAVFTEEGIVNSGMVACLTQGLDYLRKSIQYQFTPDKTVRRRVVTLEGEYTEDLTFQEVSFLAEQLATLAPVGKHRN